MNIGNAKRCDSAPVIPSSTALDDNGAVVTRQYWFRSCSDREPEPSGRVLTPRAALIRAAIRDRAGAYPSMPDGVSVIPKYAFAEEPVQF